MRQKFRFIDHKGKVTETIVNIPDKDHLQAQIKFKATIQKSKKTYTRKVKHKKGFDSEL